MADNYMGSMLSQILSRQMGRDKRFFKPIRQQVGNEVAGTDLIDAAKKRVDDPMAQQRQTERAAREAARYGATPTDAATMADQQRIADLRSTLSDATTMNTAQMDQYGLNVTRRNALLDTMRGIGSAAQDSANSLLQAQNRREQASAQADAAASSAKQQAIGTAVGLGVALM